MNNKIKRLQVCYYAALREMRGVSEETFESSSDNAEQLYDELAAAYGLTLNKEIIKVAVNDKFVPWNTVFKPNDTIVFIPPVAGG